MIDKVDIRVPRNAPFTRAFQEVYEASMRGEKRPWSSSRYFASTADLRGYGYDVRLHMYSILTPEPIHKLEIYDTGDKTLDEMRSLTASIFDIDPDPLGLMRIDACADIWGTDVPWFKRHTIIQSKQTNRELGQVIPYMTIRKGRAETLYAGVKPNQYRVYNKAAERMVRYLWYLRQLGRQAPHLTPTPYEVMYGHSPDAVITRVERQISGRDLDRLDLTQFEKLKSASTLSPFEKVVFYKASTGEPKIEDFGYLRWTSGMFVRQMVQDHGLAETRAWMREKLGRNMYREWKQIEPFLRVPENQPGLTQETLQRTFQVSARKQIEGVIERHHEASCDLHPRIEP